MALGERFEDIWSKVNDGSMLSEADLEALRVDEEDSDVSLLMKGVLMNRYLLVQQQSVLLTLLEGQMEQTEDLETLAEESDELSLNERLHLLERQAGLEARDEAAAERMRELFFGD